MGYRRSRPHTRTHTFVCSSRTAWRQLRRGRQSATLIINVAWNGRNQSLRAEKRSERKTAEHARTLRKRQKHGRTGKQIQRGHTFQNNRHYKIACDGQPQLPSLCQNIWIRHPPPRTHTHTHTQDRYPALRGDNLCTSPYAYYNAIQCEAESLTK